MPFLVHKPERNLGDSQHSHSLHQLALHLQHLHQYLPVVVRKRQASLLVSIVDQSNEGEVSGSVNTDFLQSPF